MKKFFTKFKNLDLNIAAIVLGALIFFTFFGVIARYFFNRPIYWGEEFQLFCLVIVVFFGAGAGFRAGSHVAIDFVVELLPKKMEKAITIIVYLLSVAIMVYLFIQSSVFVRQMYLTERITNILRIPFFIIYSAFPISCVLIIINYTAVTYFKYVKPDNTGASE